MTNIIKDDSVLRSQLLILKPLFYRPYIFFLYLVFSIFLNIYFKNYANIIKKQEWTFVLLLSLITIDILLYISPNWSIQIDTLFNYHKTDDIKEATHIKIEPLNKIEKVKICRIENKLKKDNKTDKFFCYNKRKHFWNENEKLFFPPKFLFDTKPKLGVFQKSTGLNGDLNELKEIHGKNEFEIPQPTFLELFKEHAIAPFFVFQVFCVSLWFMDDQWYYSLFSLFMFIIFEVSAVLQRKSTISEFQSLSLSSYKIYVYRDFKWKSVDTKDLLPNDVISISSQKDYIVPCDCLLIDGSVIVDESMLSGESTPLLKESIKLRDPNLEIDPEGLDKNSILYGGSTILQVVPPTNSHIDLAPVEGALAVVIKTGFETVQGSLVRMIAFSTDKISLQNKEIFFFILFLLVFALVASCYVWKEGSRMGRSQRKLILDCIIIITSVVPPELPMELTIAVNSSISSLQKFYIYCTEPFKISHAGKVDVCCFDKTGTLTANDLAFEGIMGLDHENGFRILEKENVPLESCLIIGVVHSLIKLNNNDIVGDPMEKESLKAMGWVVDFDNKLTNNDLMKKKCFIKILRRFQFSSSLKRSSAIASTSLNDCKFVAVKGAPETLHSMFSKAPDNYEKIYKHYAKKGSRVLALGYKYLKNNIKFDEITRELVESNLIFGGFIVFHSLLKHDAKQTIEMLNKSCHRSIMITGDNSLTACHVAKELCITTKEVLILDAPDDIHNNNNAVDLIWRNIDETYSLPFSLSKKINIDFKKYDLCITGYALSFLTNYLDLTTLLNKTWVYARVSPTQKEFILSSLKSLGYITLMCGDGTNDIGALKLAHVGIALLNGTEKEIKKSIEKKKIQFENNLYEKKKQLFSRYGKQVPQVPFIIAHLHPPSESNPHYLNALKSKNIKITDEILKSIELSKINSNLDLTQSSKSTEVQKFANTFMNVLNDLDNSDESSTLKIGDASVVASFTSKLSNISAVTSIIRQGRCALVSTIQMYKILALNCLISSYSLSVLYLAGIKFGDSQSTISGILLSICFLSISKSKPLEKLSEKKPNDKIFSVYIIGSILSQFFIHILSLIYIRGQVYILEPRSPKIDLEKEFVPSLLNTSAFILQLSQQVTTFYVNYQGYPFREKVTDNKGMYYGLLSVIMLIFSCCTEMIPELNQLMKLVPMTLQFKLKLLIFILFDFFGCLGFETFFKHFFMAKKLPEISLTS